MVFTRRTPSLYNWKCLEEGKVSGLLSIAATSFRTFGLSSLSPVLHSFDFYPKSHSRHCPKRLSGAKSAACFLLHIWLFVVLTKEQESFSLRSPQQAFPPLSLVHIGLPSICPALNRPHGGGALRYP